MNNLNRMLIGAGILWVVCVIWTGVSFVRLGNEIEKRGLKNIIETIWYGEKDGN